MRAKILRQIIFTGQRRRMDGQAPFNNDWEEAMAKYGLDLSRRIVQIISRGIGVEKLRDKAVAITFREARLGLKEYVESEASLGLDGLFAPGHAWVIYLLETHLGDTIKRIDQRFLDKDKTPNHKDIQGKMLWLEESLVHAKSDAIKSSTASAYLATQPGVSRFLAVTEENRSSAQMASGPFDIRDLPSPLLYNTI